MINRYNQRMMRRIRSRRRRRHLHRIQVLMLMPNQQLLSVAVNGSRTRQLLFEDGELRRPAVQCYVSRHYGGFWVKSFSEDFIVNFYFNIKSFTVKLILKVKRKDRGTLAKRDAFRECKKLLHQSGVKFALQYPATPRVDIKKGLHCFKSPQKAIDFIRNEQSHPNKAANERDPL
ncbi:hypothetical protein ABVT39_013793 [Epinephelus coioides]